MRSLFIYLKNYKKETILAPLFKMLEASFELLVPLVMAAVIDKGIAQKDSPVYYKNVSCFDCIGNRRADMFSYSSIIFRQKRRLGSEQDCGMRCLNIFNISVFRKWMKSAVLRL